MALPAAGPGVTIDSVEPPKESDRRRDLDMGTLGFATWTAMLDNVKRQRVVKRAIQQAAATAAEVAWMEGVSLVSPPRLELVTKAEADAQAAHACRILQR